MQEVLLTDYLGGSAPIYDKDPGPAYVIDGASFISHFRQTHTAPPGEETVVESRAPHRVDVPMAYVVDLKKSPDDLVFELVRRVAELGSWVDYEESFDNIRAYFDANKLPLSTVVKHPTATVQVPPDIKVIEHEGMLRERFYCLTFPEHLGRMPVRQTGTVVGDVNDEPVSIEQCGFLIFNPRGVLTAFV